MKKRKIRISRVVALVIMIALFIQAIMLFVKGRYDITILSLTGIFSVYALTISFDEFRKIKVNE